METKRRIKSAPDREEQTRAHILATTKELVQRYGLRKVTMEDIATALGKKKSFLYYYFPGKQEVIYAMVKAEFEVERQNTRLALAGPDRAVDKIQSYFNARVESVIKQTESNKAVSVIELLESGKGGDIFLSLIELRRAFDREEELFLAGLIRQGIKEGSFRPLSHKVISDIATFMFSVLRGVQFELVFTRDSSPDRVRPLETALEIFLEGLAVRSGRRG